MCAPSQPARTARRCPECLALILALLTVFSRATPTPAHVMPSTAVMLDLQQDAVSAELILPLQELELGFKQPMLDAPDQVMSKYGPALREYLLAHVHPVSPDGRPWSVEVNDVAVKLGEQPLDLVAHLSMRPPPGAPVRRFTLNYDVIVHEVVSHKAFVFIRNDWRDASHIRPTGEVPPMPEAIGLIRYLVYSVNIDRSQGETVPAVGNGPEKAGSETGGNPSSANFWRAFGSWVMMGVTHIAGGFDHLLFLFVLLLPAPLRAAGRRWGDFRGLRPSFVQLLKIVTAFTVGHSLTLIIGGFGWLRLPQRPVEILIAASILVSAVHAIRPFFAGWEPWVAGGFGLVHGLAFSGSIAGLHLPSGQMVLAILGFNLGIEVMQLAVVLAIVPTLILLSRSRSYTPVRIAGAAFAGIAALVWIGASVDLWAKLHAPKPRTAQLESGQPALPD